MAEWKKISPAGIYECSECGQTLMTCSIDIYKFCMACGRFMSNNIEPRRIKPESVKMYGKLATMVLDPTYDDNYNEDYDTGYDPFIGSFTDEV